MTQTLKTTERLGVVDALRGFALLAIVLLHNLEHYNLFLPLDYTLPAWLQTIDKYAWDTMFFLFAGKAYATFSLLFGFSFYIQFHNAEKRGTDFRGRFVADVPAFPVCTVTCLVLQRGYSFALCSSRLCLDSCLQAQR